MDVLARPAPTDHVGLAALLSGCLALAWTPAALWPASGLPAWPAVSLGLCALVLALGKGRPIPRAFGAITGLLAATFGTAQIGLLWSVGALLR
jgi:hypothetical protein